MTEELIETGKQIKTYQLREEKVIVTEKLNKKKRQEPTHPGQVFFDGHLSNL